MEQPMHKGTGAVPAYGYLVVAAGFLIWLFGGSTAPVFSVLLKPVLAEYGWLQADAALGYSLYFVSMGIMGVVMGRLTDKVGPRMVVTIFGSFLGIAYLLLSQIRALWQFQFCYGVIIAVGCSALIIPITATIVRWYDRRRGLMMGIAQAGVGFSGLAFAPLVAWLTMAWGWRWAYGVVGILCLAGTLLGGLCLRRRLEEKPPPTEEPAVPPPAADAGPCGYSLRDALGTGQFWIISALFMGFGFCRSAFLPFTAPLVQEMGFSLADGANVVATLTMASIFGRLLMGRVADSIGNRRTLVISEGLTCVAFVLGMIVVSLPGLYLYALVFGFGWGAQAVLRYTLCTEAFGLTSIGVVMGTLHLAETLGAGLGLYLTGYIFDVTGSYAPAFWVGLAISLLGLALSAWHKG